MTDFQRATDLHQQGNLQEAEKLYRQVLDADPEHADAWHMLGVLAHQVGQSEPALQCIGQAIQLAPRTPIYWHNQALVYFQLSRLEEAAASLERLLKLQPENLAMHEKLVQLRASQGQNDKLAIALRNAGNALADQQRYAEAIHCYRQAAELRPRDVELLNNLGVVYMESGNPEAAIGCYRQAVALRPQTAELHNNLANALLKRGRHDEAAASYREALRLKPNYPKAANNFAVMLIELGNYEEAVPVLIAAIRFRPDLADMHCNLGVALKNLGRGEEALQAYRRAIEVDREFVDAHHNLANLLLDANLLDKAETAYRQALKLQPDDVETELHLALTYKRQGSIPAARESLRRAMQQKPNQPLVELREATLCPPAFMNRAEMDEAEASLQQAIERFQARRIAVNPLELLNSHAEPPFNAQFFAGNLRQLREGYARIFQHLFPEEPPPHAAGRKPRVGFVVTKGHEGVFLKSLRGVLTHLNRERFEVVVIASVAAHARICREVANEQLDLIALPERPQQVINAVRGARLTILYHWEVGTDSLNYFLPMFRCAPIQCASWGLQLTSGMEAIDCYLSSSLVEPPDAAEHYREELLLADTLLTYQYRPQLPAEPKTRADFGLADDQHVYTCAQHLGKFHPDFDATLAEILNRDGRGVLVITQDRYNIAAETLRRRFANSLGDVAPRVHWLPRQSEDDYRSLLAASDVLLDPPHFGGVNSTYDGLALGKPIVTCPSPLP